MFYSGFMEESNETKTKQKYQTKQKQKGKTKTKQGSTSIKDRNVKTLLERKSFLCIYVCYNLCSIFTSEISHAFLL